jgi:hypothetical protein
VKRLVLVVAVACSKRAPPAPAPVVRVDHRVETVAMVERLAGEHEYSEAIGPYTDDVDHATAAFAHHPVVELARAMHDAGLAYERPMQLALHATVDGVGTTSRTDLEKLDAAIDQFAADAKLDAFFAAHAGYIASVETAFRTQLATANPIPFFTGLVGKTPRFTLVPALLQGPQNYGVRSGDDAYQLIGLGEIDENGLPKAIDGDLIVHEMTHAFVNPMVAQHADFAAPAAQLFRLVEPQLRAQAYSTPRIMVDESIVRAVTVHYVRTTRGDAAAATAIRGEVRRGFVWTAALEQVIANGGARDFETRAPELAAFFAATAKRYDQGLPPLPFAGPIDAVYRQPFAIVTSPATLDQARDVAATIFHAAPTVTPATEASFADHPHTGLVAYGTAATNPVIASALPRTTIAIDESSITVGARRFAGEDLAVIACVPRADDATHGLVIYAAASDAGVAGINELRAGATDWVVGRRVDGRWQVVATGDF